MTKVLIVLCIVIGLVIVWFANIKNWLVERSVKFAKKGDSKEPLKEKSDKSTNKVAGFNLNRELIDYTSLLGTNSEEKEKNGEKPGSEMPMGMDFLRAFEEISRKK